MVSAFWFSEAYIWSSPDLNWVTRGSHTTPDRLNERPIFFRAYAFMLAVAAASTHFYSDRSSLRVPISRLPSPSTSIELATQSTHPLESRSIQVKEAFVPALQRSAIGAAIGIFLAPFIYSIRIRHFLWWIHLLFAKPWFELSRTNAHPSGYPPLGMAYLCRSFAAGFLLLLTWDLSTNLCLIYFNQEPTKMGLPLSASSKDPNGTLLTGLTARRPVVKTFAFWELAIIAQKHKDRRRAIFEDIERPTGPMWPQILQCGLQVLQDINLRITGPLPSPAPGGSQQQIKALPSIVSRLPNQSIAPAKPKQTWRQQLVSEIGECGNGENAWNPPIELTKSFILDHVKPPGVDSLTLKDVTTQKFSSLLPSTVTYLLTTSTSDRINATVLGSPVGNAALIVDVIESITKMLVASLAEDTYGKATPTVPDAVRTFTKTLTSIEALLEANKAGIDGGIEEVEIIVERLRAGLGELLAAFHVYLVDVGLGISELNQAHKAVANAQSNEAEANGHRSRSGPSLENGDQPDGFSGRQRKQQKTVEHAPSNPSRTTNNNSARKTASGTAKGRLFPRRKWKRLDERYVLPESLAYVATQSTKQVCGQDLLIVYNNLCFTVSTPTRAHLRPML